jgi:hypothetical protein
MTTQIKVSGIILTTYPSDYRGKILDSRPFKMPTFDLQDPQEIVTEERAERPEPQIVPLVFASRAD